MTVSRETCAAPDCSHEFDQPATGRRRVWCSDACRKRTQRRRLPAAVCPECGTALPAKRRSTRIYCSRSCMKRALYRKETAA